MVRKKSKESLKVNQALARGSSRAEYSGTRRSSNIGYYLNPGYHLADQKRNTWGVAGYPDKVYFDMHWTMAGRFGIAKAGIHHIVDKCWEKPPKISDGDYDEDRPKTQFEKDLDILIEKHKLFIRLKGLDWRQRIGRYGAIIPIVRQPEDSALTPEAPMPSLMGVNSIIKLLPVTEAQADVTDIGTNSDLNSENYGDPLYYNFRQDVTGDRNPIDNTQHRLHPSRLFVFAEGSDDGSIYGIPANEAGFNHLLDMEKVIAAGAEGLFKNAKQRLVYEVNDAQVAGTLTTDSEKRERWEESNDNFNSGFDTSQILYGMEAKTLQSTITDPSPAFQNALNAYAASINEPATILIGQQTGRLASDEDQKEWGMTAQTRCENVLSEMIKGFIDYLIKYNMITAPNDEVKVEWESFVDPTQSEKLANTKVMEDIDKIRYDSGRKDPLFTDEEKRKTAGFEMEPEDGDIEEFEKQEPPVKVAMSGNQPSPALKNEGK